MKRHISLFLSMLRTMLLACLLFSLVSGSRLEYKGTADREA